MLNIGIDEVARGCFFGRVYVAAVILPDLQEIYNDKTILKNYNLIKDSKKLTKKQREELADFIKEYAIEYSIAYVENNVVDEINILQATQLAMHKTLDNIIIDYDKILVDGNYFNQYKDKNYECIIKGDNKFKCIAAASILAKVCHDNYIKDLCLKNKSLNRYDLCNNMGYGTYNHIMAIKKYGITKYHRNSFLKKYTKNNF